MVSLSWRIVSLPGFLRSPTPTGSAGFYSGRRVPSPPPAAVVITPQPALAVAAACGRRHHLPPAAVAFTLRRTIVAVTHAASPRRY
jgi:hypothetical protein